MFLEVLFSLVAIVAARVIWMRWRYDLHKIPSPPGFPVVGHMLDLSSGRGEGELNRYLGTKWKELGEPEVFKLSIAGKIVVYVRSMDCAKNVILSNPSVFPKNSFAKMLMLPVIGNDKSVESLTISREVTPFLKAVRRMYANGLQSSNLKAAMPKLHRVLDKTIEYIEIHRQDGPIEFEELCVRMTLDAIGVVAFDTELGGLDKSRQIYGFLMEAGRIAMQRAFNPVRALVYQWLPFLKGAQEEQRVIDALTREWDLLTSEMLKRNDPPVGEEPMWHILRSLKDPESGHRVEYNRLRAEVATVVVAGTDSSGHQLSCIFALLASSPDVVEKLIEELKEHGLYGPDCRMITLEDLGELSYLTAIIKEGMRMAYVIPIAFDRECSKDTEVLGYRVPKGTFVTLVGSRWLNSESEWEDPRAFKPERWLTGEDMSQKYYLPFSYGPRDCIGQKLAMLKMRLAVARIIQNYSLTATRPAEEILKDSRNGLIIEAPDGIWLHAHPRHHTDCQ